MTELDQCQEEFDYWIAHNKRCWVDVVLSRWKRRRLETGNGTRPLRDKTSPSAKKRMYFLQNGVCPWCHRPLGANERFWHVDHLNPNLTGDAYNHPSNKQLMHPKCNEEKNAMSIEEQAKHTGRTYAQLVEPGIRNAREE